MIGVCQALFIDLSLKQLFLLLLLSLEYDCVLNALSASHHRLVVGVNCLILHHTVLMGLPLQFFEHVGIHVGSFNDSLFLVVEGFDDFLDLSIATLKFTKSIIEAHEMLQVGFMLMIIYVLDYE